jgi:hypothetical protein
MLATIHLNNFLSLNKSKIYLTELQTVFSLVPQAYIADPNRFLKISVNRTFCPTARLGEAFLRLGEAG